MRFRVSYLHPYSGTRPFRFLTVEAENRRAASRKVLALIPGSQILRVIPGNERPLLPHPTIQLTRFSRMFMP